MDGVILSNTEKPILYLDFDNTIVDTIKCITDLYNEDFKYYKKFRHVNEWEIDTYDFTELKCASREYINTYFNQPRFFERLEFMPWAERVIKEIKEDYIVKIISMGYSPNLKQKEIFVKKKFSDVEFIGINFKEYPDKSHIDMYGAIFVDDSVSNLKTSNATVKICFGDEYSWNRGWGGLRLANWMDVKRFLTE